MAAIAQTETRTLPPTLKEVMAKNHCPITKEYLRRSVQIAERIREDHKSWSQVFNSLSEDKQFGVVIGGVLGAFVTLMAFIPTVGENSESKTSLFTTLFRGGLIAIPSLVSGGYVSAKASHAKTNAAELEKKLPEIRKELEQSGLAACDIEKITSIFDREILCLRTLQRNEGLRSNYTIGIGISSAAWMLGTATGIPILPTLSIIGGVGSLLATSARYGISLGDRPQEKAKHLKSEIQQLQVL